MTGIFLSRSQRQTIDDLDREGWRLTVERCFIDGSLQLSGHHFRSFDRGRFLIRDDGSFAENHVERAQVPA